MGLVAGLAGESAKTQPRPANPSAPMVRAGPIAVAMLVGEGATLIDFAGPWEVLSSACYADGCAGFDVYSVSASRLPVICDDGRAAMGTGKPRSGLSVTPDYTFEEAPRPDILIVGAQLNDGDKTLEWIRHVSETTTMTASVCTGAFILAKSGLLDGRSATTNRKAYDAFEKSFPKVKLVRGVRFVEDGKFATATGLTAGIDLALRITERCYGRPTAERIAAYEEWRSDAWVTTA
jgi:transcriptional regulator GlxA family with amidase domain